MPNHLHLIVSFSNSEKSINRIIGNGKGFMSYATIKKLKEMEEIEMLNELKNLVKKTDKTKNKKHEVFEPSFDWKFLESDKFMIQKLDYIHTNPIRHKTPIVTDAIEYRHSSALQYFNGKHNHYQEKLLHEMKDINLTKNQYGLE